MQFWTNPDAPYVPERERSFRRRLCQLLRSVSAVAARRETVSGLIELTRTIKYSVETGSDNASELVQWLLPVRTPPTWMLSKVERTDLELFTFPTTVT